MCNTMCRIRLDYLLTALNLRDNRLQLAFALACKKRSINYTFKLDSRADPTKRITNRTIKR